MVIILNFRGKVRIEEEFADVLRLLQFNTRGHDLFRRWYVDGRIFFQKVIDAENTKNGITELKYLAQVHCITASSTEKEDDGGAGGRLQEGGRRGEFPE